MFRVLKSQFGENWPYQLDKNLSASEAQFPQLSHFAWRKQS
jgi:hypothetical protein